MLYMSLYVKFCFLLVVIISCFSLLHLTTFKNWVTDMSVCQDRECLEGGRAVSGLQGTSCPVVLEPTSTLTH